MFSRVTRYERLIITLVATHNKILKCLKFYSKDNSQLHSRGVYYDIQAMTGILALISLSNMNFLDYMVSAVFSVMHIIQCDKSEHAKTCQACIIVHELSYLEEQNSKN
jgi:hypothetical protein